jgi:hypothetical protein
MSASYGDTFSHKAMIASRHQWVAVGELLEIVDQLNAVKYALQQERIKGTEILSKLNTTRTLVSKTKRFPDDDVYIDLQSGDWPSKFEQVRTALNYKPPENSFIGGNRSDEKHSSNIERKRVEDKSGDSSQIQDISERQKFEKSMKSYYTGLESMENQIGQGTGLFTQTHFEKHYYLVWK